VSRIPAVAACSEEARPAGQVWDTGKGGGEGNQGTRRNSNSVMPISGEDLGIATKISGRLGGTREWDKILSGSVLVVKIEEKGCPVGGRPLGERKFNILRGGGGG